ncbi:MAG: hypothetical protein HY275_19545, partial [Gemmatimonadetes bacterium]|nr:hypothetical protein [Gemmatimonadota bacterium]
MTIMSPEPTAAPSARRRRLRWLAAGLVTIGIGALVSSACGWQNVSSPPALSLVRCLNAAADVSLGTMSFNASNGLASCRAHYGVPTPTPGFLSTGPIPTVSFTVDSGTPHAPVQVSPAIGAINVVVAVGRAGGALAATAPLDLLV